MAEESNKQPVMNENSRYPATLPHTLPILGQVRRSIKQDEDTDDEDYIPFLSGKDHPEYVAGRNNPFKGITHEEIMEVKAKVDEYLRNHPFREQEFTEEHRRRMDEVAKGLYQAVAEGKCVLRMVSAPSLMPAECACSSIPDHEESGEK